MKTITLSLYHPWGTTAYCVECWYRSTLLRSFEGHEHKALLELAKAWAIINGYTHAMHRNVRSKL